MRRLIVLLLIPVAIWAQPGRGAAAGQGRGGTAGGATQAPPPPPTPPQDLATVEGQIFNGQTGEPLRKATISMNRSDSTPTSDRRSFSATSDGTGRFVINSVAPGTYRMNASHTGFLNMQYNARRPDGPGTTVDIGRAQRMSGVIFRLSPHGVVTGKVVDEDGDPLENVQVQLMRIGYNQGKKQLQQADGSQTNDLGEYRMAGVTPGKYFLAAINRNRRVQIPGSPEQEQQLDYVTTFYPGGTDVSAAAPIQMKAGEQVSGINLRLTKIHTVHVRGRVANNVTPTPQPDGRGGRGAQNVMTVDGGPNGPITINMPAIMGNANMQVRLQPRNALNPNGLNVNTQVKQDGTFDFASVAPGPYTLIATTNQGNHPHTAKLPIDVGSTNLDNLTLNINPGVTLMGHIKIDGTDPSGQPAPSFTVRLNPREPGMNMGAQQPAKVDADGNFRIDDISPDRYNVTINPQPMGYYIRSMRAGNIDVMANGVDLSNGAATVEVVISPNAPQLTGAVQNSSTGQPGVAVTVLVVPQEPERKEQAYYYRTATTDQYGHFTMQRVVPGEYRVFAFEDVESGAWYDPDFMKPVESRGQAVSVKEGTPTAIQLTLIVAQ